MEPCANCPQNCPAAGKLPWLIRREEANILGQINDALANMRSAERGGGEDVEPYWEATGIYAFYNRHAEGHALYCCNCSDGIARWFRASSLQPSSVSFGDCDNGHCIYLEIMLPEKAPPKAREYPRWVGYGWFILWLLFGGDDR